MTGKRFVNGLALLGIVMWAGSTQAAIVYDNAAKYSGLHNELLSTGQADSVERGNHIVLEGAEREVTEIVVYLGVFCCGVALFDAEVRFYANDGPGGSPGSLLWASTPLPGLVDSGNPDAIPLAIPFAVPNVVVPDSFTWTVQITNRQGNMAIMGPSEYNPPAIGSAPFGYWEFDGMWTFAGADEPPFGARVTADLGSVPATSPTALVVLAVLLVAAAAMITRHNNSATPPS